MILNRWEIFYKELLIIDIWGFTIASHLARRHFGNCFSWNLSTWKTKLSSTTCWRNFKLLHMSTKLNLILKYDLSCIYMNGFANKLKSFPKTSFGSQFLFAEYDYYLLSYEILSQNLFCCVWFKHSNLKYSI